MECHSSLFTPFLQQSNQIGFRQNSKAQRGIDLSGNKSHGKNYGGKRYNKGYVSVVFIALFAALALAIFSLYDAGIVASERIRMQNTADNVAYSTTNMITRDMNIIAITNRAMVANQVAIGQVLALASWANMVQEFAGNLETLGDFARLIPVVGPFIERFTEIIYQASTKLKNTL
ncbi:pilus assembly protein TadG-related protein [Shewanella gaetbuli]